MSILYTKKEKLAILGLLALSLLVHFAWFGHPNSAVFDEVHFGKFISAYFTHEYYFDIHPPLGKLILAGWGWLWGFRPGFSFANIGDVFPDRMYMTLRFLPSLAGALLPLVIYGLARRLRFSHIAALLAGVLIALDNALAVQSRLILLDPFLLLFGFSALWCYFRWRDNGHPALLPVAGLLGGMAVGIKWTGATFLGLIIILELIRLWHQRHTTPVRNLLVPVASFVLVPFAIYYAAFSIHFALLYKSGTGDAFMTVEFQRDLQGSRLANDPTIGRLSGPDKFIQLNEEMYRSNQRLTATHPYSSAWYSWPLLGRSIFYWVTATSRIYLLGNPVVWWASTVAVLYLFATTVAAGIRNISPIRVMLLGAWLMNMLPFIGISRVMFLYHYLTALIWAVLMLAYIVDTLKKPARTALVLSALALACFVFFAPLTYGLPMSDGAYHQRLWFRTWQ